VSHKAQRNTSRYCDCGGGGSVARLKQTTRNLCIHLANVGRETASFHGFQIRGGFGRNRGWGRLARPRYRQDCDRTRNT